MFHRIFDSRRDAISLGLIALIVALAGARPFAGGWNDGSRLAAVESLAERGVFAIDDSCFVAPPHHASPYDPADRSLARTGTMDKLLINGRYYSDKSPVPSLLLAGVAVVWKASAGLSPHQATHSFCWWLNFIGGGCCYVLAVLGIHFLAQTLQLTRPVRLILVSSFALGSIALPYSRHLNNHVELLAVTSWLLPMMLRIAPALESGRLPIAGLLAVGLLAGIGYTIDLGMGPLLLACVAAWLAWKCLGAPTWRVRFFAFACVGLGALPWCALHHAVNYSIAGVIGPANSIPAFLQWPGSPFNVDNMTGRLQHPNLWHFLGYAGDMLAGKHGFLSHNLPLYLAILGVPLLARRRFAEKSEFVFALVFCAAAFVVYAVSSNNYSGRCLSIRWFVPLLAPGYFVIGLMMREAPRLRHDFVALAAAAVVWAAIAWIHGPWNAPALVWFWLVFAIGMAAWAAVAGRRMFLRVVPSLFARPIRPGNRFGASIFSAASE